MDNTVAVRSKPAYPIRFSYLNVYIILDVLKYLTPRDRIAFERVCRRLGHLLPKLTCSFDDLRPKRWPHESRSHIIDCFTRLMVLSPTNKRLLIKPTQIENQEKAAFELAAIYDGHSELELHTTANGGKAFYFSPAEGLVETGRFSARNQV